MVYLFMHIQGAVNKIISSHRLDLSVVAWWIPNQATAPTEGRSPYARQMSGCTRGIPQHWNGERIAAVQLGSGPDFRSLIWCSIGGAAAAAAKVALPLEAAWNVRYDQLEAKWDDGHTLTNALRRKVGAWISGATIVMVGAITWRLDGYSSWSGGEENTPSTYPNGWCFTSEYGMIHGIWCLYELDKQVGYFDGSG
jgi:hypothetical protein